MDICEKCDRQYIRPKVLPGSWCLEIQHRSTTPIQHPRGTNDKGEATRATIPDSLWHESFADLMCNPVGADPGRFW